MEAFFPWNIPVRNGLEGGGGARDHGVHGTPFFEIVFDFCEHPPSPSLSRTSYDELLEPLEAPHPPPLLACQREDAKKRCG